MSWITDLRDVFTNAGAGRYLKVDIAAEGGAEVLVRHEDERVHNLEGLCWIPHRRRGNVATADYLSMMRLVTELDPDKTARIYYGARSGQMAAVLNDDQSVEAGWRDFTVSYTPQFSEAWDAWKAIQGQMRGQIEMAEFIEERVQDFIKPSGAEMLELAQNFQLVRAGRFESGIRLNNGDVSFTFESVDKAKSTVKVPSKVELGMRVFDDLDAYRFPALFRYRANEGGLKLAFKIENTRTILDKAVADVVARVEKLAGGRTMIAVTQLPVPTKVLD